MLDSNQRLAPLEGTVFSTKLTKTYNVTYLCTEGVTNLPAFSSPAATLGILVRDVGLEPTRTLVGEKGLEPLRH